MWYRYKDDKDQQLEVMGKIEALGDTSGTLCELPPGPHGVSIYGIVSNHEIMLLHHHNKRQIPSRPKSIGSPY